MDEDLRKELAEVRRRGLSRIQVANKRLKPLSLPVLTQTSAVHQPGVSDREAVSTLIRDGIARLSEDLAQRTLNRLFGLDRDPTNPKPDAWRAEARAWHPVMDTEEFRRGPEWHCLGLLADSIGAITSNRSPRSRTRADNRRLRNRLPGHIANYITRHDLAAQFDDLLEQGHDRILLLGQPGMGKNRLAGDLTHARASAPGEVIWVHLDNLDLAVHELRTSCEARGVDLDPSRAHDHRYLLHKLVTHDTAPEFVVLSGLELANLLIDLLPPRMNSTLVATAWAKTTSIPESGILRVGPFTAEQTAELLSLRCPRLSPQERKELVDAFAGHPAVVAHLSWLINSGALSVDAAVTALRNGASAFMAELIIDHGHSLGHDLARLTAMLEDHHPLVSQLLQGMVFMPPRHALPLEFLEVYATENKLVSTIDSEIPVLCARAVRHLREFGLADQQPDGIALNPHTQAALRAVYEPHFDDIYEQLEAVSWFLYDQAELTETQERLTGLIKKSLDLLS